MSIILKNAATDQDFRGGFGHGWKDVDGFRSEVSLTSRSHVFCPSPGLIQNGLSRLVRVQDEQIPLEERKIVAVR